MAAQPIRALKRVIPHGVRDPLREVVTAAARPYARVKIRRRISAGGPLRINLGSGFAPIAGWTNIDLAGAPADVPWNLKHGIPFEATQGGKATIYPEYELKIKELLAKKPSPPPSATR